MGSNIALPFWFEVYFAPFNKDHIFFTYLLCLLFGEEKFSVLTEVSVGDNVPVVLIAVALNLLPVTMISRCLIELHCVSSVTSSVGSLLTCQTVSQHIKGFTPITFYITKYIFWPSGVCWICMTLWRDFHGPQRNLFFCLFYIHNYLNQRCRDLRERGETLGLVSSSGRVLMADPRPRLEVLQLPGGDRR